jgi:hypothetical protein
LCQPKTSNCKATAGDYKRFVAVDLLGFAEPSCAMDHGYYDAAAGGFNVMIWLAVAAYHR